MRLLKANAGYVAAGSSKTLSRSSDNKKIIRLDTLAGSTVILPPSIGDQCSFLFIVTLVPTSNGHIIKVANATDIFRGLVSCLDSDLATVNNFAFAANGTTFDTLTLDGVNTGAALLGEWVEVIDYAAGFWFVRGQISGAAPATPFTATVS